MALATLLLVMTAASAQATDRPSHARAIILTDIGNEPEDSESLVRLLPYASDIDIEGLVATTSVWQRDRVQPALIQERLDAYAKARANLLRHDSGYPSADALCALGGTPAMTRYRRVIVDTRPSGRR
ncbi:nucleoside hydrolase-like domain-containing protein [Sphingomonas gellani]|uniref:nucleoside hydrolase-like domain-containing protein n=1 Tax=Sphingomonas gellani TaxID=1166340 RepID=UPI001BAEC3F5|nr:nucleoside hydrolase-like domain-containing protein [Sphingomonas gellani]